MIQKLKVSWTKKEIEILKRKYKKISNKELCKELGKTYASLTQKAFHLNLCKPHDGLHKKILKDKCLCGNLKSSDSNICRKCSNSIQRQIAKNRRDKILELRKSGKFIREIAEIENVTIQRVQQILARCDEDTKLTRNCEKCEKEFTYKNVKSRFCEEHRKGTTSKCHCGNFKRRKSKVCSECYNKMRRGGNSINSKLTEPEVITIKKMFKEGKSRFEIHDQFSEKVSQYTINAIIYGNIWKHIEV